MKRAWCLLCLLPACTRTTELLGPTPTALPFCPTTMDVYGGTNVALRGCGGPSLAPASLEDGTFAPDTPEYGSSLAGRLYARLVGDPDLAPRFGSAWKVRSCSAPGASLVHFSPALTENNCGQNAPNGAGSMVGMCADHPAPLVLLSAGMLDDRCHGGGPDSSADNDPATYNRHFASRLDAFLIARHPQAALVGPTTEWTAKLIHGNSFAAECAWSRPDWDISGLDLWIHNRSNAFSVGRVADLHGEFQRHSHCCKVFDAGCEKDFLAEPGVVNCDGAQTIVDLWYQSLKALLLAHDFVCPAASGG
jgi:hypothetical protein